MIAPVISLAARRSRPEQTCTCVQHRLWDLSDRVREALAVTEGELLVSRETQAGVLEDVLATLAEAVSTRTEAER
ncbi:hypothetical protein [Nocardioides lianchengensis]|uniref:Uncharacterized protein n=1 Tax=Nocardioides lianchengensis TaxID=1045774 RepID=A0A1G6YIS8_9ACTN|nr:hypothetical protein [Nocardioides lianchengensis]NYG09640.1 hypothetical protein [Nocardioides lianchengensis]SDD89893.1 hypothetical protein SAMN05421872_11253 [Nocardioides lianchengensis]